MAKVKKDDPFKSISVSKEDHALYDSIRASLSKELGVKVSMATAVKLGMTFYNQRRNLVPTGQEKKS